MSIVAGANRIPTGRCSIAGKHESPSTLAPPPPWSSIKTQQERIGLLPEDFRKQPPIKPDLGRVPNHLLVEASYKARSDLVRVPKQLLMEFRKKKLAKQKSARGEVGTRYIWSKTPFLALIHLFLAILVHFKAFLVHEMTFLVHF